ncbi:MAG: sulfatase [Planctomycetales bacterium]|nr:sulfatase [Planctomycetales bacterium]
MISWLVILRVVVVVLALNAQSLLSASERPPNIILFLVDDLGWKDLGCYGSSFYETPHADALAQRGVRFTQAYAACHVCSPTRASILTGKYPARLQLTDWLPGRREFAFQQLSNAPITQYLPAAEITIAEALKQHGYATAHIGKWHLGEEPFGPLNQGFDVQIPRWNKGWPKSGYYAPFQFDGLDDKDGQYLTDRLTDEAIQFMESHRSQPFFLYMSHFAVHDPIQGRKDLVAKYQSKRESLAEEHVPDFILEGNPDAEHSYDWRSRMALLESPDYSTFRVLPNRMAKIKQRQDNVQFAAMVEAMDESLGRICQQLEILNLAENTVILFFSDNGGMSAANFGNPERVVAPNQLDKAFSTSNLPLRGAKGWLYEGGIRVPLIVYWPNLGAKGHVCDEPVISTDLFPTILEIAALDLLPEQHVDGLSLAKLVSGQRSSTDRPLFWHFPHYSNHGMQSPGGAIRLGDYKLLEYFERGTIELFNLRDDISEQQDLAQRNPEKAAELLSLLRHWREDIQASSMLPNPMYIPPAD